MQGSDRTVDEHALAAFLAGTLPNERRRDMIEYLAADPEARDVLQMAAEALEAARGTHQEPWAGKPFGAARTRPAPRIRRYLAAILVAFGVVAGLHLAFEPTTSTLRSPLERGGLTVRVDAGPTPSISWPAVEDAYRYRLVVWDPEAARVVGEYETTDRVLDGSHPVLQKLESDLQPERSYVLRVDAVDAQNRLVTSSAAVDLGGR